MKKSVQKAIEKVTKKLEAKKPVKEETKVMKKEIVKKEIKKEMKKESVVASKSEFGDIRKMYNKILTSNKGLTLVENKHGAIQVKRSGDLLFSARSNRFSS
jgi:hypothetical protein